MISVLYVDDEPALLDITRLYLEKTKDFVVDTATSAAEALEKMKVRCYDGIVSDYQMPDMDGIRFLKEVRAGPEDIPFILFTGKGREEVVIEAINNGADFYLQKGGDAQAQFAELAHKIRQAVRKRKTEAALRESEERYRNVVEDQTEFIARYTPDGRYVFVNEAYCRYFNIKREEIIGRKFVPRAHPEDQKTLTEHFASLSKEDPAAVSTHRVILDNGEVRWHQWTDRAIFNSEGSLVEYQSVGRDITRFLQNEEELKAAYEQISAAEEELRAQFDELKLNQATISEDRFFLANIFSSIQDGISILDKTLTIVRVNPTMERWYSHSMPLTGKKCWVACHQRHEPCDNCPSIQSLKTGEPEFATIPRIGPDGIQSGMIDLYSFPLRDSATGEIAGVIEYLRDVTRRWKIQAQLEESEARFRRAEKVGQTGNWEFHLGTGKVVASEGARAVYGIGERDMLISEVQAIPLPEYRQALNDALEDLIRRGKPYSLEFEIKKPNDGNIRVIQSVAEYDREKNVVFGIFQDITGRRKAEEALHGSEKRIESVFRAAPVGIGVLIDRGFVEVNDFFCEMLGYSREEVIGRNARMIYPSQEEFDFVGKEKYRQIADKGTGAVMTRWLRKDGRILDVHLSSTPVEQDNPGAGMTFTAIDVTEQKQAEEALRLTNRQLSLLNSVTRHDISNKITSLSGYIALAKMDHSITHEMEKFLGKLEFVIDEINAQIEFTRIYQDLGTREPQWQNVDVIISRIRLPPDIILNTYLRGLEIYADPMFEHVFTNLVDNSVRHGCAVSTIRISFVPMDHHLLLVYEDNGSGIPVANKERIFEHGFGRHTGLGLFLVRDILSITGITIIETGAQNKGARFEIMVPGDAWRLTNP